MATPTPDFSCSPDLETSISHKSTASAIRNSLLLSVALITFLGFAIAELVAALLSGNLSLLADSLSMFVDSFSYATNSWAERRKQGATKVQVLRLEIATPAFSVLVLLAISVYIVNDAVNTLSANDDEGPDSNVLMLVFASLNLLLDAGNMLLFSSDGCRLFSFVDEVEGVSDIEETSSTDVSRSRMLDDADRDSDLESSLLADTSSQEEGNNETPDVVSGGGNIKPMKKMQNMNMCSAYTHVWADTMRSTAVLVAASISLSSDGKVKSQDADAWAAIVVSGIILASVLPLMYGLWGKVHELNRALVESSVEV